MLARTYSRQLAPRVARFRGAKSLLFAAILALSLAATPLSHAGDWLGGQYWGQIAGCADCGGSLYGGGLPPCSIWVGEIGWGSGTGCGCEMNQGDIGPILTDEEMPSPVMPRVVPAEEIIPDSPRAAHRISYVEAVAPAERELGPQPQRVRIVTHASQPKRLRREPLRIVSPDGSAGRMYR